jgi:hypothetical protein
MAQLEQLEHRAARVFTRSHNSWRPLIHRGGVVGGCGAVYKEPAGSVRRHQCIASEEPFIK